MAKLLQPSRKVCVLHKPTRRTPLWSDDHAPESCGHSHGRRRAPRPPPPTDTLPSNDLTQDGSPAENSTTPTRWLLMTYQRTCSNLFSRILDPHPSLLNKPPPENLALPLATGYFFLVPDTPITCARDKPPSQRTADETKLVLDRYEESFAELSTLAARAAAADKKIVVKEHINFLMDPALRAHVLDGGAHRGNELENVSREDAIVFPQDGADKSRSPANITMLADAHLATWGAIILIRHPALVVTSQLRADTGGDMSVVASWPAADGVTSGGSGAGGAEAYYGTLRLGTAVSFSRKMYEYLSTTAQGAPPVIDADDLIDESSGAVVRLCKEYLDIDPSLIKYEWDEVPAERQAAYISDRHRRMVEGVDKSRRVDASKSAQTIVLEDEVAKWKVEFGDEVAARVEAMVREDMEDYLWLRERRLRNE